MPTRSVSSTVYLLWLDRELAALTNYAGNAIFRWRSEPKTSPRTTCHSPHRPMTQRSAEPDFRKFSFHHSSAGLGSRRSAASQCDMGANGLRTSVCEGLSGTRVGTSLSLERTVLCFDASNRLRLSTAALRPGVSRNRFHERIRRCNR